MGCILSTNTKQQVVIKKVCLAYRSFEEEKKFKIAKNVEKRAFGRMNRALSVSKWARKSVKLYYIKKNKAERTN